MALIKKLELFMEKKEEEVTYDYGCVMLDTPFENWNLITSMICEEDLVEVTEDIKKAIEDEPHTTILYGLHKKVTMDDVKEVFKDAKPITLKMSNLSCFENDDFDVLKFDVESTDLNKMNKSLTDNLEYSTDYPDYHPHITVAYLKPGTAKKYCKDLDSIELSGMTKILWSPADGEKDTFNIG
jgi:hypothetical protein